MHTYIHTIIQKLVFIILCFNLQAREPKNADSDEEEEEESGSGSGSEEEKPGAFWLLALFPIDFQ